MGIKHSRPVPPFVRYCSAIIPTMFDDSLSYYEALCALNRFIQKNLVEIINNNATVTQEYIELTNQLKEYVENYFDNLDVQQEINNKLDEMAESGVIASMLVDYVDPQLDDIRHDVDTSLRGMQNQINSLASSSPIPVSSTDDMTDTTKIYVLTTDGKWYYYNGANWTEGGDYQSTTYSEDVDILKSNLYYLDSYDLTDTDLWHTGGINANTGAIEDTNQRIRMGRPIFVQAGSSISIDEGYEFNGSMYSIYDAVASYTFIGSLKPLIDSNSVIVPYDCYIKLNVRDADRHGLYTDDEINEYGIACIEALNLTYYNGNSVKNKIKFNNFTTVINPKFDYGNLANTTGFITTNNRTRFITQSQIKVDSDILIYLNNSDWNITVGKYDNNQRYTGYIPFNNSCTPILIKPSDAKYITIAVKKSYNQTVELTAEELIFINSQNFIFKKFDSSLSENGDVSGKSIAHIANNNQGGYRFPAVSFPASYSLERISRLSDFALSNTNHVDTQGMCAVGNDLIVTGYHTDDTNTTLFRFNPSTGCVTQMVNEHAYGHANGMAYIKDLNKIYMAGFHFNVPDDQADWGRVYVINPTTLEYESDFSLDADLSQHIENYKGIGAVGYSEKRGLICYLIRDTGNNNRGIAFYDLNGNYVSNFRFTSAMPGGICCLDDYILIAMTDRFMIFDYEGNLLHTITGLLGDYSVIREGEGLAMINGKLYLNANNNRNSFNNNTAFVNVMELTPTSYKSIDIKTYLGL